MPFDRFLRLVVPSRNRWAVLGLLVLPAVVLLRTAWVCDDAFITFRTIDNLVHGHGLRWNLAERVQVFTHPLWLMVLTVPVAVVRNAFVASIVVSIACSLAAVGVLVLRVVPCGRPQLLLVGLLMLSSSFVDYSTSGLENPLTSLLLAMFLAGYLRDDRSSTSTVALSVLVCFMVMNRLDLILLVAPALSAAMLTSARPLPWKGLVMSWLPLALWEGFSLVYFGSLIPNTAYAKVGSGHDPIALIRRGFDYLYQSALFDPVIALCLVGGLGLCVRRPTTRALGLAAGIAAYVAYVARIGGDFMIGRMLTAPFLVGAVLIVRSGARTSLCVAGIAAVLALLSGACLRPLSCVTGRAFGNGVPRSWGSHGISDERRVYYPGTGLMSRTRPGWVPSHPWATRGERLRSSGEPLEVALTVGMLGYYAGPSVHIVDHAALCDPFLARLPARYFPDWRVGHYWRVLPDGYLDSLIASAPKLKDPQLNNLADLIFTVSRAPIMRAGRLRAVWVMTTGSYEDLIDDESIRFPGLRRATLGAILDGGLRWVDDKGVDISGVGIELSAGGGFSAHTIELALTSPDWRTIEIGGPGWHREIHADSRRCQLIESLFICRLSLPVTVSRRQASYVRVFPTIDPRPETRSPPQVVRSAFIGQ